MQARQTSENKSSEKFDSVHDFFARLTQGQWGEQFSEERLADAMAICREDWDHFRHSSGAIPEKHLWLPDRLAIVMFKKGLRTNGEFTDGGQPDASIRVGQEWLTGESQIAGSMPVRQRLHNLAQHYGILRGHGVRGSQEYGGCQPKNVEELAWPLL